MRASVGCLGVFLAASAAGCGARVGAGTSVIYVMPPPAASPAADALPVHAEAQPANVHVQVALVAPPPATPAVPATPAPPAAPPATPIRATVYFVEPGSCLQNPDTLTPVATFETREIDVPMRDYRQGFPGVPAGRTEWFEVIYRGAFAARTPGSYMFRILSDDGGKVWVDGREVTSNGTCAHPESSAEGFVTLAAGVHEIGVEYLQGPGGGESLRVLWTPPGGGERVLNTSEVP